VAYKAKFDSKPFTSRLFTQVYPLLAFTKDQTTQVFQAPTLYQGSKHASFGGKNLY
jgi:hypothetical protein